MIRSWWKRYLYAVGAGNHLEPCTFCDQTFDIRDPGQVLVHQTTNAPLARRMQLAQFPKTSRHRCAMWCRSDGTANARLADSVRCTRPRY